MRGTREAIYSALFGLVSGCAPFAVTSRVLKDWADTPAQPALYQMQSGEVAHEGFPGLPLRWTLSVRLFIYAQGDGGTGGVPSQALNPLLDAVEQALAPAVGKQTLGGLVESAWIDGQVNVYEGVLGQQAVAIVPVSVLTHA